MNAIRADEELGNLHSLYVDQWDWERVITAEAQQCGIPQGDSNPYLCSYGAHRIYGI